MVAEVRDEYETNLRLKLVEQQGEHLTARYIIGMDSYETILSLMHPCENQCVIKLTGGSSPGKGLQLRMRTTTAKVCMCIGSAQVHTQFNCLKLNAVMQNTSYCHCLLEPSDFSLFLLDYYGIFYSVCLCVCVCVCVCARAGAFVVFQCLYLCVAKLVHTV